jgi:predicted transcriptional regulator
MPTTIIRLDEDLNARIAAAAGRAGKSPHAFIVDTLTETIEQNEIDEAFDRLAEERWAEVLATGETVGWDETKAWLEARARGESPERPRPRRPSP